jgi:hypothetical protein
MASLFQSLVLLTGISSELGSCLSGKDYIALTPSRYETCYLSHELILSHWMITQKNKKYLITETIL